MPSTQQSDESPESELIGPLKVLREATAKVPATIYALAVAGIAAASAIVRLFVGGDANKGVLVLATMLVFMVAMLVFARLARFGDRLFRGPAIAILWSSVLLFIAASTLSLSSVFFGAPLDWRPTESSQRTAEPTAAVAAPAAPQAEATSSSNNATTAAAAATDDNQHIRTGAITAKSAGEIDVGVVKTAGSATVEQDIVTKDVTATGGSKVRVGVVKKD